MKNFKSILFAVLLVAFVGNTVKAQEKVKPLKDKAQNQKLEKQMEADVAQDAKMQEMFKKSKAEATTAEERAMIEKKRIAYEQSRVNNGKAYGKNKGELEGKEFGQERAALSKKKLYEAYNETRAAEATIEESSVRIKMARERLEANKSTMTADELAIKEAKISTAEKELKDARQALENQRKLIKEKHESLDSDN
ncbi:hypothetical protein [Hanstruepera ponticola]|uniref:hypothetical protein n=1 Tax=Hanstruepera ponticola TaxID=2042995 RepID=UPI000CF196FF|nr:hypothetical protein [Hanstruepera ponticola]